MSIRGPKLRIFAAVLAVICFAVGIYLNFFQARGFVKTTGTIVSARKDTDSDGDTYYYPTVEYTVDGKTYSGELNTGSGSDQVGKTITVRYNPENPAEVRDNGVFEKYILLVGAAILLFVIGSAIAEKKSQKRVRELREERGQTRYAPSVQGEERELYFLTDLGTPKYGHRIEDRSRRVLYEAKMTKFTLTQPFGFDFIDHENGSVTPHLVGHKEDTEWDSLLLDNHSTFELDGVSVWKHLRQNGVSVETALSAGGSTAIGAVYRILRDGAEIARAETASQYPHEEDAAEHKIAAAIPAEGFFRVWTREKNLDLLFVTLLAFARSSALDDRGGSYGAIRGTLKRRKTD